MLALNNVTFIYSPKTPFEKKAIDGVSFEIKKGEVVGIIGHTGSGKSTLIQLMNGILKPTDGEVLYNGEKIDKVNTDIGMVFQYPENQIFEETIEKELKFGPKNIGMAELEIEKAIDHARKLMGIQDIPLTHSPFALSGGQKRKIAIASVLAMQPEILVFDEPTAGLDPRSKRQLLQTVKETNEQGKTVVVVSHSMDDIAEICTRIIVMNKGKISADDTVNKIFSKDNLTSLGLDTPEITKYMQSLGYENIWTIDQAEEKLRGKAKEGLLCQNCV